ncbi:hypothetical protein BGZ63DRAFT_269450 [Mariannaea sp. PMI_226]|nr:hypothetical protein BGZ63DRAFT_269450 [Mariannaea sp. PMI_226]
MLPSPLRNSRMLRGPWEDDLRRDAVKQLKAGRYDLFPLKDVQLLTDGLLRSFSGGFLRRDINPHTVECDELCFEALKELRGELWTYEAAIVSVLHVISAEEGRKHINGSRFKTEHDDEFALHQARAYLQCLVLAFRVRPEIFNKEVPIIANDLLLILKEFGEHERFPSVLRVLRAIEDGTCEDFLSKELIQIILRRTSYQQNLDRELRKLFREKNLFSIYCLVGGLRSIRAGTAAAELASEVIPHLEIWMPWTPNPSRIKIWDAQLKNESQIKQLHPVLELEGPDIKHHLETFRRSSPGQYGPEALRIPPRQGHYILDCLLQVFDKAVRKGEEAVSLFITLCVRNPRKISWMALDQVEAAVEACSPTDILKLDKYMRYLEGLSEHERRRNSIDMEVHRKSRLYEGIQVMAKALPVIQSSNRFRRTFGHVGDLEHRSARTMSDGQLELLEQLDTGRFNEAFAIQLGRLGGAMLRARWLHAHWSEAYVDMLQKIPNDLSISTIFKMIRESRDDPRIYCDALASTLGGCDPEEGDAETKTVEATIRLLSNPIWSVPMQDYDCNSLRDMLLREAMRGFSSKDATACVKQSQEEHNIFVREMRTFLAAAADTDANTDAVCIHLTNYLGVRCKDSTARTRIPAECWRQLLLHLMRCRPPGLLERCGPELPMEKWTEWTRNLQKLFGERHYDPEGGLGFTKDKFNAVTARKIGVGRMASTSTYSTTNSDRNA